MQKLSRSLIALGGLAALAACGDDVSITPPATIPAAVVGVTVSPTSLTLKVGESAALGVSVETTGGAGTGVTWSSSSNTVATVSATGTVTAVAAGNTTVRATSTVDNTKSGAAQVTVTAPVVRSVTVSPTALALTVGQTATAVATVDRDAPLAGTVTWASSTASVATVSAAGLITGVSAGTSVITATSTADNTKSAALAVTVSPVPNNLLSLNVAPTNVNIGPGASQQLTATVNTVGTPTVTYTYASGNTGVATVSNTGLVTGVAQGTTVVTVSASTNTNTLTTSVTVNVNAASVSISSLTTCTGGPPCTVVPVNLAGVAGQIEATLNINSGAQQIAKVDVLIDNVVAATQNFGVNGAPNAPVTLSINTAEFDANYNPKWINGLRTISAKITPVNGGSPTASNTIQFTLTNPDVVYFNPTGLTHTGNSATGPATAAGTTYWKGGFTYSAFLVAYSGQVASLTYTSDDCGSQGATASPWVATFSCAGVENNGGASGATQSIQNAVAVAYNAGYTLTAAPTTFMTAASAGYVPGKPVYAVVHTNEDNVGPTTATPAYNNVNIAGWHGNGSNGAALFSTASLSSTITIAGTTYSVSATDLGVASLSAAPTMTEVTTGLTPITAANQLAQTLVPSPYYLRGNATSDALGNLGKGTGCVGCNADGSVFGVDLVVTDAQYSNRTGITPAIATLFPLTSADSIYTAALWAAREAIGDVVSVDAIDNNGSGLDNSTALTQRIVRSNPGLPTGAACLASTTYSMNTIVSDNYARSTVAQSLDCGLAAGSRVGRYAWASYVKDRAGNALIPRRGSAGSTTALDSIRIIIDEAAPNITGIGFQTALYVGGQPASFSFSANDDYEIKDGLVTLTYGGALPASTWTNPVPTVTYNYGASAFSATSFAASPWDNTWVNVLNGQTLTLNYLLGGLDHTIAGGSTATISTSSIISNAAANVRDWASQVGGGISAPILSTQVTPTANYAWATLAADGSTIGSNMTSWALAPSGKTTTSITMQQVGITSVSKYTCSRIDIFSVNAGSAVGPIDAATTTALTYVGTTNYTAAPPFTDNGINRFHNYTVTGTFSLATNYVAACVQGGRALFSDIF